MAPLQILIGGSVMFVISQVKSSRVKSRPVKSTDETAHTPFRPESVAGFERGSLLSVA